MKKRLPIFLVFILLGITILTESVFASAWGTFEGYPIAKLILNGKIKESASPPIVINGRTYVPLRFISENLGASVSWEPDNYSVIINSLGHETTLPTGSIPPISAAGKGVAITLTSFQANSSGTTLNMKIDNNSNYDIDFPASLIQIVAGSTQFDGPSDYDVTFASNLHPGVTKEGYLEFPALPSGITCFKIYLKAWVGNSLDTFETTFDVKI